MAQTKQFTLATDPHVAAIGPDLKLHFVPEVIGDDFLDAYTGLQEIQKDGTSLEDLGNGDAKDLRRVYGTMRTFLAKLMLRESAEVFLRFEVIRAGELVDHFRDRETAQALADELGGSARVEDKSLRLPDRILLELLEWVLELYGSGGNRPTTSSKGSSRASSKAGTTGKGPSRSKGSTPTRGRSAR